MVNDLLTDGDLRSRCSDLLRRGKHLDRAVREAMTVLEDRLRRRTGLDKSKEPSRAGLVRRALHHGTGMLDLGVDRAEQEGVFNVCLGLMAVFANPAHHALRDDVARGEALAICGMVNWVLVLLESARVRASVATAGQA